MGDHVGVDLGSAVVDCAVLSKKGKSIQLKDYFSFKKEAVGEDRATDVMKIIAEFDAHKLNNTKAAISVPDKNFILISFKLPKLPPKEKDIAVKAEIEQKLPFGLEEAAFDVVRLNAKETNDNDYVAFCTRLNDVHRYHAIATNYNVIPDKAMTEAIANLNCAEFNGYMEQKDISYLLLDIGAMHVGFTLVTNGLPWLTFCMAPKDTFSNEEGKEFDAKVFLDQQISDIGKIISSFEEKSIIAPIKKVLLFGKQEMLDFVEDKVKAMTPLNVERVDPLKNIEIPEKMKEAFNPSVVSSVAVGLALSNPELEVKANVKG